MKFHQAYDFKKKNSFSGKVQHNWKHVVVYFIPLWWLLGLKPKYPP